MAEFGVLMFPADYAIQPVPLARAAEERGFESLFFPEHTHIPASRVTPWPGGADLPTEYWHTHDPFVALGAAAAATRTSAASTWAIRRSCASSRKLNSRHTATASGRRSCTALTTRLTSSSPISMMA